MMLLRDRNDTDELEGDWTHAGAISPVARASNPEIVRQPLHLAYTTWEATQEHR
jgi:hypothetical protein